MLRPWKTILQLELNSGKAVFLQIADGIIGEIKKGRLKPGASLPGSRVLAHDLGVNRKTVVLAYEELTDTGWLSTAHKRGTFVSEQLPEQKQPRKATSDSPVVAPHHFNFRQREKASVQDNPSSLIVFDDGLPDARLTPLDELSKAYKRILLQNARWCMMGYRSPKGELRLRSALCNMLMHDRALNVQPERICITRGSQMALYLTAHTLVQPGDRVAMETPGYRPAWEAFKQAGALMEPIPVDDEGLCVEALEKLCSRKKIKAVYVTPHHQFPTTVSMKIGRRLALLALSRQYGFAIVEDDYDHEYHFGARSLLPLASDTTTGNVIYISSLSKLLSPALRIGYVTGPEAFIDSLSALRMIIDRQGDTVMENAVAELMEGGAIHRHAKRAFNTYKARRDQMASCLDQYLAPKIHYQKPEGGLAYWVHFNKAIPTTALAAKLLTRGVQVNPSENLFFDKKTQPALRLGYASLDPRSLEEGIKILASAL